MQTTRPVALDVTYDRSSRLVTNVQMTDAVDAQFLGYLPDFVADNRVSQTDLKNHVSSAVAAQLGYRVTSVRLRSGGATVYGIAN